jgi:hypothetical protein
MSVNFESDYRFVCVGSHWSNTPASTLVDNRVNDEGLPRKILAKMFHVKHVRRAFARRIKRGWVLAVSNNVSVPHRRHGMPS